MQWHAAYGCYVFMGLGLLMPWNSFITAIDYFSSLYPGAPSFPVLNHSRLPLPPALCLRGIHRRMHSAGYKVDTMVAVAYNIPNLLGMISMLPFSKGTGSSARIVLGAFRIDRLPLQAHAALELAQVPFSAFLSVFPYPQLSVLSQPLRCCCRRSCRWHSISDRPRVMC